MLYQAELRSLPEQAEDKLRDRSRIASAVLKFLVRPKESRTHQIREIHEKLCLNIRRTNRSDGPREHAHMQDLVSKASLTSIGAKWKLKLGMRIPVKEEHLFEWDPHDYLTDFVIDNPNKCF